MVIALIGASCTGKSSIAEALRARAGASVITGKDYLRMAKTPGEAEMLFKEHLRDMQPREALAVFVISEPEALGLLPEGTLKVHCHAPLDIVKDRFAARMQGNLPPPVAAMLEKKHHIFDEGAYALRIDTASSSPEEACALILSRC
jgi:chloramphenicol 3-O-phosphotransferase